MSELERPLEGLRVIEMGQLLAGPFTGTILAYFGAEVIKVEPPGGDPIRGWREVRDGTSLWYRSLGRNKKSVTLDLEPMFIDAKTPMREKLFATKADGTKLMVHITEQAVSSLRMTACVSDGATLLIRGLERPDSRDFGKADGAVLKLQDQ